MTQNALQDETLDKLRALDAGALGEQLQSDEELLSLFVDAGDADALERLIERYAAMVASVCRLTVTDAALAEDAFQATFLVLLQSAKKVRRRSSVAAWLHGVAYRTASRIRKQAARERVSDDAIETVSCDGASMQSSIASIDPVAELARKMELEVLNRELENLPDRWRVPLIEHYLLGFTAPQIAARLELSVTAVEGRLKRGRRNLRTQLAKRGISLSVLAAGSTIFQSHVQAYDASSWAGRFLEQVHGPPSSTGPKEFDLEPSNSNVSSLVQGEVSMLSASTLKTMAALGLFVVAGGLALIATAQTRGTDSTAAQAGGFQLSEAAGDTDATVPTRFTLPRDASQPNVAAQLGQKPVPPQALAAPQASGAATGSVPDLPWQTPTTGETPVWLSGGKASTEAMENNRAVLAQELNFDFNQTPLTEMAEWLSERTHIQFEIDETELDRIGIDSEVPVTVRGSGSIRELLRRSLSSLELTYRVTESTIEITSTHAADASPTVRFYDLSYVLPNSSNVQSVLNAIQQTVTPDGWMQAGGTYSVLVIGSMLVVSAPDSTHQQIEILLINLTRMNPANVERATPSPAPPGYMGGMGGGMGGMGGGMF